MGPCNPFLRIEETNCRKVGQPCQRKLNKGTGYELANTRANILPATSKSSRLTSKCVTTRKARSPTAFNRTPALRQSARNISVGLVERGAWNITLLVSTPPTSTSIPGIAFKRVANTRHVHDPQPIAQYDVPAHKYLPLLKYPPAAFRRQRLFASVVVSECVGHQTRMIEPTGARVLLTNKTTRYRIRSHTQQRQYRF